MVISNRLSPLMYCCVIFLQIKTFLSYQSHIKQSWSLSSARDYFQYHYRDSYHLNILKRTGKTTVNAVSPEFKPKTFNSFEEKIFKLNEVIENEVSECTIRLANNGKITFLQSESGEKDCNACVVSGSWKHENNNLRMVIERLFIGKYATYTVKSYYKETRKETSHGLTFIGGEVCDTTAAGLSSGSGGPEQPSHGQFLLVSQSQSQLQLQSQSQTRD